MTSLTIKCLLTIRPRDGETPEETLARANVYLSGGYELVMISIAGLDLSRYDTGCPRLEFDVPQPTVIHEGR